MEILKFKNVKTKCVTLRMGEKGGEAYWFEDGE